MMNFLLILCKFIIVLNYACTFKMIYDFKMNEKNVKFEFDLLSSLELSTCVGINLVALLAVISKSTYMFTLFLSIIGISLAFFQRYRIILVGDRKILFKGKVYKIKNIKKLATGLFTLKILTRQNSKEFSIFIPLTSNNTLKYKLQEKLNK